MLSAANVLDSEPFAIRAGDSVAWTRSLPEFSAADGWALKYRLLWPTTATPVDIASSATATDHAVSLTAATTAAWPAGRATLVAYVERTVEAVLDRVSLESRSIDILPDLTTATSHDGRSQNAKALADLEAALAAYIAGGQGNVAEYTIGDRHMKFKSAAEIRELMDHYKREVARERGVSGKVFYRG